MYSPHLIVWEYMGRHLSPLDPLLDDLVHLLIATATDQSSSYQVGASKSTLSFLSVAPCAVTTEKAFPDGYCIGVFSKGIFLFLVLFGYLACKQETKK